MKNLIIILITISLVSCQSSILDKEFDCEKSTNLSELKEYKDFLKNFKIDIPKNWKTNLYYDEYSSEIHSADTTKRLTKTYLLNISWNQGELNLDDTFANNINDSLRIKEHLKVIKSGFGKFKSSPSYFNLSVGQHSGYPYQYLQVFIKTNVDEYIQLTSKVYGKDNVDKRLCESIEIFDGIKLLE